jgi:hypothetical protein
MGGCVMARLTAYNLYVNGAEPKWNVGSPLEISAGNVKIGDSQEVLR